ncbi:MAG: EamA family transporter [Ideonella sp. MAG2]|nr:MAG: EamA family transporter [Ideonella sp. MAG2]
MLGASFLFATMGVCVKLASAHYSTGEIVFYRGLVGLFFIWGLTRWRGGELRTRMPAMHLWRSISGVAALSLWFYAIGTLPLPTAITLNYMSSIWMALFLMGGAIMLGAAKVDGRLVLTVLVGFAGVALVLQPTLEPQQFRGALAGLLSGMLSAFAYLQVTALGRAGEPEYRVVFYFSLGSTSVGLALALLSGLHSHTWLGAGLLLATGLLATTAQIMMTRAYAIGRTLSNASLQYMGIAFSFVYGIALFGEGINLLSLLGVLLIVGAGIAATLLRRQADPVAKDSTLDA